MRLNARQETVSASASLPHRMNTPAGCSMRQDPGGDVRFNATDNTLRVGYAGASALLHAMRRDRDVGARGLRNLVRALLES